MSDFPLYLNTVAGGLDRRDQTIGGFSFVVKIYAVPVVEIIGYTCDFPRIRRFDTALELHGMTGTLICFDYQEEALREICGQCVMLQSIDFQQLERSVLYS